jgi:hypothetical protein
VSIVSAIDLECISLFVSFVLLGDSNNSAVVLVFKDLQVTQEYPVILFLGVAAASHGRRTKLSLMSPPRSAVT